MVLYRKYRPQKLSELDLESVHERLINIFSSSYTPHAFLFAGPRGTGKTSSARIVAKVLNCEKKTDKKDIEPCNKCATCTSITSGCNLDVLEIDAASNRGIDEIRELREKIKLAPSSAKYKVYIIDEVHMLTNEAFNALLKTLEEPPKHAVFILATTMAEKLPSTIISRCIKLSFQKAKKDEIIHSLKRVVKGEKVSVDKEVLALLADFSDGSFRDATKMLEQSISEKALSVQKIKEIFGKDTVSRESFITLLVEKNTNKALNKIVEMSKKGADFRFFTSGILNFLHGLLLYKFDVNKDKSYPEKLVELSVKDINKLIRLFSQVFVELKSSSRPDLPLEIAIVEWCES